MQKITKEQIQGIHARCESFRTNFQQQYRMKLGGNKHPDLSMKDINKMSKTVGGIVDDSDALGIVKKDKMTQQKLWIGEGARCENGKNNDFRLAFTENSVRTEINGTRRILKHFNGALDHVQDKTELAINVLTSCPEAT